MTHPLVTLLRSVLALVLGLASVALVVATVGLSWFHADIQDEDAFAATAQGVAADQGFRDDLVDAAVQDIMDSSQVTQYLGDGSDSGHWYSGLQDFARDKVQDFVQGSVQDVADSDGFQSAWDSTARATHTRNLGEDPSDVFVVDASPIYDQVDQEIRSRTGVDLKLDEGEHLIAMEQVQESSQEGRIAQILHRLDEGSQHLPVYGTLAALCALGAAVVAPRGRILVVAAVSAVAGLGTWLAFLAARSAWESATGTAEGTGGVIERYLVRALDADMPTWGLTSLGVGLGCAVVLVILHVALALRRQRTQVF